MCEDHLLINYTARNFSERRKPDTTTAACYTNLSFFLVNDNDSAVFAGNQALCLLHHFTHHGVYTSRLFKQTPGQIQQYLVSNTIYIEMR